MLQRAESETNATGGREVTRWMFRHEKIVFYCMLPAFLGKERRERREKHIADERFWGLYELLAVELAKVDEDDLYRIINAHAADSNENELRNRYERARRRRSDLSPSPTSWASSSSQLSPDTTNAQTRTGS